MSTHSDQPTSFPSTSTIPNHSNTSNSITSTKNDIVDKNSNSEDKKVNSSTNVLKEPFVFSPEDYHKVMKDVENKSTTTIQDQFEDVDEKLTSSLSVSDSVPLSAQNIIPTPPIIQLPPPPTPVSRLPYLVEHKSKPVVREESDIIPENDSETSSSCSDKSQNSFGDAVEKQSEVEQEEGGGGVQFTNCESTATSNNEINSKKQVRPNSILLQSNDSQHFSSVKSLTDEEISRRRFERLSGSSSTRPGFEKEGDNNNLTPVKLVEQIYELLEKDSLFYLTLKGILADYSEKKKDEELINRRMKVGNRFNPFSNVFFDSGSTTESDNSQAEENSKNSNNRRRKFVRTEGKRKGVKSINRMKGKGYEFQVDVSDVKDVLTDLTDLELEEIDSFSVPPKPPHAVRYGITAPSDDIDAPTPFNTPAISRTSSLFIKPSTSHRGQSNLEEVIEQDPLSESKNENESKENFSTSTSVSVQLPTILFQPPTPSLSSYPEPYPQSQISNNNENESTTNPSTTTPTTTSSITSSHSRRPLLPKIFTGSIPPLITKPPPAISNSVKDLKKKEVVVVDSLPPRDKTFDAFDFC